MSTLALAYAFLCLGFCLGVVVSTLIRMPPPDACANDQPPPPPRRNVRGRPQ